jgi:hypothetical protein
MDPIDTLALSIVLLNPLTLALTFTAAFCFLMAKFA